MTGWPSWPPATSTSLSPATSRCSARRPAVSPATAGRGLHVRPEHHGPGHPAGFRLHRADGQEVAPESRSTCSTTSARSPRARCWGPPASTWRRSVQAGPFDQMPQAAAGRRRRRGADGRAVHHPRREGPRRPHPRRRRPRRDARLPAVGYAAAKPFAQASPRTLAAFRTALGAAQQSATDPAIVPDSFPKFSDIDTTTAALIFHSARTRRRSTASACSASPTSCTTRVCSRTASTSRACSPTRAGPRCSRPAGPGTACATAGPRRTAPCRRARSCAFAPVARRSGRVPDRRVGAARLGGGRLVVEAAHAVAGPDVQGQAERLAGAGAQPEPHVVAGRARDGPAVGVLDLVARAVRAAADVVVGDPVAALPRQVQAVAVRRGAGAAHPAQPPRAQRPQGQRQDDAHGERDLHLSREPVRDGRPTGHRRGRRGVAPATGTGCRRTVVWPTCPPVIPSAPASHGGARHV